MEKALYITSLRKLKDVPPGCSRIYFGAEFCQWRLPGPALLKKALDLAGEGGLKFTLMTPWVTDAGLKKVKALLKVLADADAPGAEVVVNDYGALDMLAEEFPDVTPVIGRLLARQKRCPRIPGMIGGIPEAGRELYMRSGVEDPLTAKYLRVFGVRRVELDNPLHGLSVDLKAARLKGSLYTPYAVVTVTRHCPASHDGNTWQSFTGCKLKACMKNVIALKNPAHEASILMRGNAQFVENTSLPVGLSKMGIDRVVVMEGLP